MKRRIVWGAVAGLCLTFVIAGCALLGNLHPIASFTATPNTGNSPLSVDFDASASSDPDGTIATYLWDFGDGQTASATVATFTHVYTNVQSNPQVFTAILTVTDNDGADDTAVQNITVNP
jgi:PKD repeat protein